MCVYFVENASVFNLVLMEDGPVLFQDGAVIDLDSVIYLYKWWPACA